MAKFKKMGRKAEVMHLIDYFAMKFQWNEFGDAIHIALIWIIIYLILPYKIAQNTHL